MCRYIAVSLNKFNKILMLLSFFSCLSLMPVAAVAEDPEYGNSSSLNGIVDPESELFDLINYNIGVYNQNLNITLGFLKSFIGDEQILFVITLESGGELYAWSTTENAEFIEFEDLKALTDPEPSLTVRSDEPTVRSIIGSLSPLQEFNEAIKSDKVAVEDAGLYSKAYAPGNKYGAC